MACYCSSHLLDTSALQLKRARLSSCSEMHTVATRVRHYHTIKTTSISVQRTYSSYQFRTRGVRLSICKERPQREAFESSSSFVLYRAEKNALMNLSLHKVYTGGGIATKRVFLLAMNKILQNRRNAHKGYMSPTAYTHQMELQKISAEASQRQ